MESRLGKIPICAQRGRRNEGEEEAREGKLEDFFRSNYRNMGRSRFSHGRALSRVSGLLRFARCSRAFLERVSRCNLIRLQTYASASGGIYVTVEVLRLEYFITRANIEYCKDLFEQNAAFKL